MAAVTHPSSGKYMSRKKNYKNYIKNAAKNESGITKAMANQNLAFQ